MSLRFILGRSGSGKSTFCLNEIREHIEQDPIGSPIIYLVPEQMTFQGEYTLAKSPSLGGMIRAQVFSFRRLAWKVLQEVGGAARQHISSVGIKMVLQRILEIHQQDLRIYGRAANKTGFTDQLEELYIELKRYQVDFEHLSQQYNRVVAKVDKGPEYRVLADKLHDLTLIYRGVEATLKEQYLDSEDYLRLLAEKIPYSSYIKDAEIWLDGFHGFTPQEYAVILSLLQTCKRVSISLCLDSPFDEEREKQLDLFYPTGITYLRLQEIANKVGVTIEAPKILSGEVPTHKPRLQSPSLRHLEREFGRRPGTPYIDQSKNLHLFQGVNRRAEVEGVAREILRLVRDEGLRFREIAILLRNIEDYQDLLTTVFTDYEIPIFLDQKRPMLHHPLIELLRSSFEVIKNNWPADAVFRCIKTDLLVSNHRIQVDQEYEEIRNQLDQMENYVLAYGIHGHRWTEEKWQVKGRELGDLQDNLDLREEIERKLEEESKALNHLRLLVVTPLLQLQLEIEGSVTVREKCTAIYQYLRELRVPEQLEEWGNASQAAGEVLRAREHSQVWQGVVDLLDQMVEVMGEDELSFDLFTKVFLAGLEGLNFFLVPPALDQVLIGSMERTRALQIKSTFILGVNDGVIPARPHENSLLFESERELLQQEGLELAPGSDQRLLEEEFMIYTMLTSASDSLYLSYPLADEEGKALMPSQIIKRVKQLFPAIEEKLLLLEPLEGKEMEYITHPRPTLSQLAIQLRAWEKGYPVSPLWFPLYNWYIQHPYWKFEARKILGSLSYRNQEKALRKETSYALYGTHLKASVSRLELYQSCPFSHFASYGLRLKERQVFRLEAPDIGQLFHGALSEMTERLQAEGRGWHDLTRQDVDELSAEVVDQLAPELQKEILFSSNRLKYIGYKLKNVVKRAGYILSIHARRSQFTPIGTEILFESRGQLPTLRFTLRNGCTMELVGRIDRVDQARGTAGLLLRVIDYKSSKRNLDLSEVFFGLALQMLIYLDVVVSNAESWLGEKASPAGMLYFHVHNPLLPSQPQAQDEIEQKLLNQFKMKGLVLADLETVQLMDTELTTKHSDIIPVALKADGSFYSNASVITGQQLDHLRDHVRGLVAEIGTEITDGIVDISPYQLKKKIPCTYCDYKPVCQIDPQFEENDFRKLKKKDHQEIWLEIGGKGGENDDRNSE